MSTILLLGALCLSDLSGLWDTDYGRMIIDQPGQKVECSEGYILKGKLTDDGGTVRGKDAEGLPIEFILDKEDKKLTIVKNHDGDLTKYGALRLEADPNSWWIVVLETYWQDDLADTEYSWGATVKSLMDPYPDIIFRHRFYSNEKAFCHWCNQMRFVPEPIVLFVASHGRKPGLRVGQEIIKIDTIIDNLKGLNLRLIHFGSCLIGTQETCDRIAKECNCAVSGFSREVDWNDSVSFDMAYLTLVIIREMEPNKAAEKIFKQIPSTKRSITGNLDFHFAEPE